MGKNIPLWVLVLVVFLGINFTVIFGGVAHYVAAGGNLGKLGLVVIKTTQLPLLAKQAFDETFGRSPLLIDNRFPEINGFKKNGLVQDGATTDDGYLLLSAYDANKGYSTARLIRVSDGQVLHEWAPNIDVLAGRQNPGKSSVALNQIVPARFRMGHPLLLLDGGLIFHNFEGPLFKVDACSNVNWVINQDFHHSIEQDADGNLWVPSVIQPSSYDKLKFKNYRDDAITKVSPDGKVLLKISVSKILEENGYRGLLFGAGPYNRELVHLNDIQPALYSTKYWQKGDLLLSMRHRSTVFLYRPSTNKILWLKTGPWLNQHDPDFIGQSKISVFGNDVTTSADTSINVPVDGTNNIYVADLADGTVSTPYSRVLNELDVRTLTEGRQKILDNGDVFIEESNYGRILRVSQKQAIWEFTVKVDAQTVGLVSWSRYLTKEQVSNILTTLHGAKCS